MEQTPSLPKYSPLAPNDEDSASLAVSDPIPRDLTRRTVCGTMVVALGYLALLALLLPLAILVDVIVAPSRQADSGCKTPEIGQESVSISRGYKAGTNMPCGSSWQEAKAAGCIFDLMTVSWLPLECYDAELPAEFLEAGPWPFYLSNSTLPEAPANERIEMPSIEAIGKSSEDMWTNRRFHFYHCIFGWKMMHRAVERGWKMESSLATYHHTEHCADTLSNITVPFERVVTRVSVSFPSC